MTGTVRAAVRLGAYLGWTLAMLPAQLIALALGHSRSHRIPLIYHRGVLRILGVSVVRLGAPSSAPSTLFVSNHSSYLDIEALGALVPGSFIAKCEVAGWPLLGLLARLQRSVFIDRRRLSVASECHEIAARLRAGDNLILFPEGTSNDGNRVLPFKSALFAAAASIDGLVQPVSIAYTMLNGTPLLRHQRPEIAWYGDMEFIGHLWRMAALGALTVAVEFHAPLKAADFLSRKALSEHCHGIVAASVSRALQGRDHPESANLAAP